MNWKELKDFCNKLPDDKLKNKVVLWREEDCISDICAVRLPEDMYIGEDDEGCYSLGDAGLSEEDARTQNLQIAYNEGDPVLEENF